MDINRHQEQDPILQKFDNWLNSSRIQPPEDLLARVRAHLQNPPVEEAIDKMLQLDPAMKDPQMLWKIRGRLAETRLKTKPTDRWIRWLTPLAAAATLTLAFISFQSSVTRETAHPVAEAHAVSIENVSVELDSELTQILALAANLEGTGDVSKLESIEELAFLFE